jgi:excisionase family DNA binding protein
LPARLRLAVLPDTYQPARWLSSPGAPRVGRRLGIHVNTLRRWVDQGEIRAVRLPSGYRRFEPAEVERKRRELGFQE